MNDLGRVPEGTGLSQAEPVSRLGPSGFDPSRLLTEIRSERVIFACAAAKAIPGDIWGAGAEGHYAFLCGLAALLRLPSVELDQLTDEARRRTRWWEDNHPEHQISECCPSRVFSELGFDAAIAMEARSGETACGLDPKDDSAGRQASPDLSSRSSTSQEGSD